MKKLNHAGVRKHATSAYKVFIGPARRFAAKLHVETNLQVMPAAANMAKSNRYWPDMSVAA